MKYAVMIDGKQTPSKLYDDVELAKSECERLCSIEKKKGYIMQVIGEIELKPVITMYDEITTESINNLENAKIIMIDAVEEINYDEKVYVIRKTNSHDYLTSLTPVQYSGVINEAKLFSGKDIENLHSTFLMSVDGIVGLKTMEEQYAALLLYKGNIPSPKELSNWMFCYNSEYDLNYWYNKSSSYVLQAPDGFFAIKNDKFMFNEFTFTDDINKASLFTTSSDVLMGVGLLVKYNLTPVEYNYVKITTGSENNETNKQFHPVSLKSGRVVYLSVNPLHKFVLKDEKTLKYFSQIDNQGNVELNPDFQKAKLMNYLEVESILNITNELEILDFKVGLVTKERFSEHFTTWYI